MNSYEKLIKVMRDEGARNNPAGLLLGEMLTDTVCLAGGLEIEADDYYIAEHLLEHGLKVSMDGEGISISAHTETQSVHMERQEVMVHSSLKAGDQVIVYRLNDEKYVILEKVVSLDVSV
jgi:hypothetical protein